MPERIEYTTGQKVGECFYIHEAERRNEKRRAIFKCRCNKYFEAAIGGIKSGNTKSCGCYKIAMKTTWNAKHGLSKHKLYPKWNQIKRRCYNKKCKQYHYWGGRGIKMCDEWLNNPKAFIEYIEKLPNAMAPGLTLDRIDNDGNYKPGNLRWTTLQIQAINSKVRTNNKSGFKGISKYGEKWQAVVGMLGNNRYLGLFKTIKEAIQARNEFIEVRNLPHKIQHYEQS